MNTLVVHTGGIGDFILSCPAIEVLSQEGAVTLAGYTDRLSLAVASGIAAKAVSLDSIDFHSVFAEPSERLRIFLEPFQRVIIWMQDTDGIIAGTVTKLANGTVQVFPGLPPENWVRHASTYYAECLGIDVLPPIQFRLQEKCIRQYDVIMHIGSGGRHKNWPLDRYVELTERLQTAGRNVVWSFGPAEIERGFTSLGVEHLRCDSLVELAIHLASSKIYIGNDSGITHLSAAFGVPTIVIFGPTEPAVWAPRRATVIKHEIEEWPSVSEVLARMIYE